VGDDGGRSPTHSKIGAVAARSSVTSKKGSHHRLIGEFCVNEMEIKGQEGIFIVVALLIQCWCDGGKPYFMGKVLHLV
jgi:hypothetical protein